MKVLYFAAISWLVVAGASHAAGRSEVSDMIVADVVILGEVHDNSAHHQTQAAMVAELLPPALVLEMLTSEQAARISDENRLDAATLGDVLEWDQTGWPDFAGYFPILAASPAAQVYGAGLTRGASGEALKGGIVSYFGNDASLYGLDRPLAEDEQSEREAFQHAAHCDALPESMLPMMVELQRLRDAMLARAVVSALDATGGPVVVITGNGHARKDRGLAVYLRQARPDLSVYAVGQSEDGQIDGVYDMVVDAPAVERPDPCLAFEKKD